VPGKPAKILLFWFLATCYSAAWACDVPVFRYALERWPAEDYSVLVFHRGTLSAEQREVVEHLERASRDYQAYANYAVLRIDLDSLERGPIRALWESLGEPEPPRLALRLPRGPGPGESIWSGSLTAMSARAIIDSEARREISRRILSGEAAAWVLVECGDREKDAAAAALLERSLARMEKTLELPAAVSRASSSGAPELRVGFSLVRLSRSDPAEEVFIRMLINSEPDLELYTSWPMAFPVYGRGRVLYALVGEGINEENIYEACAFLVGPCACEIKSLNPGRDLLISANWEAGLEGSWVEEVGLPPLSGLSGLRASSSYESAGGRAQASSLLRNVLLALGLIVAVIALLSYKVVKSGRRKKP